MEIDILCCFYSYLIHDIGNKIYASANEDEIDEDLADVNDDVDNDESESALTGDDVEGDEETAENTKSPDADTQLLFVKPIYTAGSQLELP